MLLRQPGLEGKARRLAGEYANGHRDDGRARPYRVLAGGDDDAVLPSDLTDGLARSNPNACGPALHLISVTLPKQSVLRTCLFILVASGDLGDIEANAKRPKFRLSNFKCSAAAGGDCTLDGFVQTCARNRSKLPSSKERACSTSDLRPSSPSTK